MKILHINCNYTDNILHKLFIQYLDKLGLENRVYVPISGKKERVNEGKVMISRCFHKRDRIWFSYKQYKIYKNLMREVDIKNYDMLHAYTLFTDGNCAYKIYKKYNIPYIVAVRNTDINYFFKYRFWLRKRGRNIIQNAKAVCFLSDVYMKRFFDMYIPNDMRVKLEEKCFVIPNGIDEFWFDNKVGKAKLKNDIEPIRLLYVGKIDKEKNLELTIKAINILNAEGYRIQYTVVGKIIHKSIYHKLVKNQRIKYVPHRSKEELLNIYRRNDIFVMPSFHESFGLVYAEAMSQGLPVIYTRNEGFDGQYSDGEVGYAVNCHNAEELAAAIKKISENYSHISTNCLRYVDKYKWNIIAEQYNDIYTKIFIERGKMQVKKEHYSFGRYVDESRWMSYYHQINEALLSGCKSILIIGKGDGIVPAILKQLLNNTEHKVDTFDFDQELLPTYCGDIRDIRSIVSQKYDCIMCCQVLEHLEKKYFEEIIKELYFLSNSRLILSLPVHKFSFSIILDFPKFHHKVLNIVIQRLWKKNMVWKGEHYWEIGIKGSRKKDILKLLSQYFVIRREYMVPENTYHWFAILDKKIKKDD